MTNLVAGIERVPKTCHWGITNTCNLRCVHCIVNAGEPQNNELSSTEALDLADQLADAGCETVGLSGGEPFMRKDWPQIARRLVDHGIEVTVTTNGTLVDETLEKDLIDAGISGVSVSIDGTGPVHDAIRLWADHTNSSCYDQAISALERLKTSPLRTAVITQIHKRNINELKTIYERLIALGVEIWQIQVAMPQGRLLKFEHEYLIEPQQLSELTEQLATLVDDSRMSIITADNIGYYSKYEPKLRLTKSGKKGFWTGCMAGCLQISISPNGDVKGCSSLDPSFVVGNVRDHSLKELWNNPAMAAYNTDWNEDLLEGECARCQFKTICRAGCTSMAFAVTGTIYDNPFCVQRTGKKRNR